jgi:hypothetical protein
LSGCFFLTQKGAELIGKILLFSLYIKKQVRGAELFPPNISSAPPPLRKKQGTGDLKKAIINYLSLYVVIIT